MKDLPTLALSVPPIELQQEIGERHRAFDSAIRVHRAITRCLEELRSVT
jgi:restriction endonuclease S subunit